MHRTRRMGHLPTLALAALLLALLVIGGCAQSPQILQVKPDVGASLPQTGNGQAIAVSVVDGRRSDVLGTRSGEPSSTSTIRVPAHDVIPKLQTQAENALRRMGYTPTREGGTGAALTLTLADLQYAPADADAPLLDAAQLQAVLRAEIVNDGGTYTGTYTAKRTQSFAIKPDWETNNRMVSDLLSNALRRAFSDPELSRQLQY
ncbi:YajG family lipoprotein [Chromohalobacter israelensis]|uniref:YajG family lipoprotein n=1 Tax=Chromohalobacter israelensis TaxID=141390 RepID=UPI000D71B543|nr:YajG family lipoprotein [Chromohalobacter salexigens]MBZ5874584.1 YajG family lipoprotein [Chromohalobacter salexigens]MDO0947062.1 YajG family lipoprotein [Chromohalobacter salexigens]PWW33933.1 putative lipoprotein [Chromohalobacter salexigens]